MIIRRRLLTAFPVIAALTLSCAAAITAGAETSAPAVRDISSDTVDRNKLRTAIASRTLTWLTGSSSNNDYMSVGRLANYFGFVSLRVSSGHSLSRSAIAKETLQVLDERQRNHLIKLVETQKEKFANVHDARFKMNRALEGLRIDEDISREDFLILGADYGAAEAELGRVIAQTLGAVAVSLTPKQKNELADIRARYVSGNVTDKKIRGIKTTLSKADKKELVNIAARLLSWTTGSPQINDYEVVGKPSQHFGFVSLRLESNHGVKRGAVAKEVIAMLTAEQIGFADDAARQNADIFPEFLAARARLMRALEVALEGKRPDRENIDSLGREAGRLEAEMTWAQAQAMLDIRAAMGEAELTALLDLRAKYTGKGADLAVKDPAERGRQLFAQCALCHSGGGDIAPELTGIFGSKIAADRGFKDYSNAMRAYADRHGEWTDDLLDAFLKSPRSAVPGTYMAYDGFKDAGDREAVIAYLKTRR